MIQLKEVKRRPLVDPEFISVLRGLLDRAEAGEVTDIVVVANVNGDGTFFRGCDFNDAWRMLGALEFAKDMVLHSIDNGED